jgi:hypothetical protein
MTSKIIPHKHHPAARMAIRGKQNSCLKKASITCSSIRGGVGKWVSTPIAISLTKVADSDQST